MREVYVNCPFDDEYVSCFEAICFSLIPFKFKPVLVSDYQSSDILRMVRIIEKVNSLDFSIHDLSMGRRKKGRRIEPHHNMVAEASYTFGAYASRSLQTDRKIALCLVDDKAKLDKHASNFRGFDFQEHKDDIDQIFYIVRNWITKIDDCLYRCDPAPKLMN